MGMAVRSTIVKSDLGLESGQPDYFAALRLLAGSNGGTTELEALENATAAARMYGDDRSAFNDDAFLRHFADLALGDGHSAMRRDGVDMGFGPESGSGGAFQENNPHPSELSLPETTNSVIRPFLYDSFLSSATDFPDTSRDNLHYSHAQPRHHSHYTTSLETLRARAYRALGRDFADEFDSLTSAGSGHAIGSYPGLGRGYSTVPPPGYICKLCFVEGHWLKNCNLYQYRRRSEYFHNYPPNASAGMNTSSLSAAAAAAIARYDGLSISAALRGLSARHSPTHMQPSNRSVGKTTVPPDGYVCRKCHTPGHWIQQCTLPKQSVPPDGYTCKICLVKGHWIHQCPHRSGANGGDAQAAAAAVIRGGIAGF
ncbi:uncharacterized protein EV422DRAFT_605431 [Fimicolochytrium jonesii]|uniref:uncharacterized protein n=1 Tax=Fimicolochytrium jonesii TaxID=1396493 RepID=UPI0022FE40EC|nr:uncharacterized protein EV422DRAFT_605431 [Fimicolochytrium jonesii]KAI8824972.1 hypothetical protein EV422DRAFT_605431 [Fimicolochytrium jonesii]